MMIIRNIPMPRCPTDGIDRKVSRDSMTVYTSVRVSLCYRNSLTYRVSSYNLIDSVHPSPWHGYPSHPSLQANPRAYSSQFQGQPQRHPERQNQHFFPPHLHNQSKPQPQPRIPPQPQTSHTTQPYYPNPSSFHHRHRNHHRHPQDRPPPQDNHKLGASNTPFNHSQMYLNTPQSVQPSAYQVLNASRAPSHHQPSQPHRRRSHSRGSSTRIQAANSSLHSSPRRASSKAPQIKSRMLKIPLTHPLVCGHRHSLIPDQIPETEIGKSVKSVWDTRQFILPPDSHAPMMIDAVQVCSLGLDWDITVPPAFAKETGRDGQVFNPPRHLHLPLINAKFKSEVCIKTRQDNPLTKCFQRWGCIVVESRDPNGTPPTMKQFLYDIWDYFHTSLTEDELSTSFTEDDLARLREAVESREEDYAREAELSAIICGRGPTRRDVLWGYTRFAGLEVCPRFADTGDLFLYLEPL